MLLHTLDSCERIRLLSAFQVLELHAKGVARPFGADPADARRVIWEITGEEPPEGGPPEGTLTAGLRWLDGDE